MLGAKVHKEAAEKARRYLARQKLMDNNYRIIRSGKFIYFPLVAGSGAKAKLPVGSRAELVDRRFERQEEMRSYRGILSEELGKDYESATKSYDIIGDIAIIEADDARTAKRQAKVVMKLNKNVKTVLAKGGPVSGKYRIRSYLHIAGEKKYKTVYRENGASFIIDVRKAFFSPRLAYERDRISRLVRKGENVMVMFAGVGPFAIDIAKRHKDAKVVAIELNKQAYKYMLENIKLNKVRNVDAQVGDVKKVAERYRKTADRIIMPLPKSSYDFLDSVLKVAKKGCVVHYYAFGQRSSAYEDNIKKLREFFALKRTKFRVISKRIVRPYSPRDVEVVIDFSLRK